jgi:hypothetical protein
MAQPLSTKKHGRAAPASRPYPIHAGSNTGGQGVPAYASLAQAASFALIAAPCHILLRQASSWTFPSFAK